MLDDSLDVYEAFARPLQLAQKLGQLNNGTFDPLDAENGLAALWATHSDTFYSDLAPRDAAEASAWALERNTWRLLHDLYTIRCATPPEKSRSTTAYYTPPRSVISHLLVQDPELLELQVVREWLHSVPSSLNPVEIRRGYLRSTANTLKYSLRAGAQLPHNLISRLDPDAVLRQSLDGKQGRLENDDAAYESALLRSLFEYIRAGELDYALDLCRQSDQSWRAATLLGGKPFYTPRLDPDRHSWDFDEPPMDTEEIPISSGNINRRLWKATCRQIASNSNLASYERAIYGAISGDVDSVLPVCSTWEDQLWAYVNALFEYQVEYGLSSTHEGRFWSDLDKTAFQDKETELSFGTDSMHENLAKIFAILLQSPNLDIKIESSHDLRAAQQLIILDEIDRLLETVVSKLESIEFEQNPLLLERNVRFFAHMVLFLRLLGVEISEDIANTVLEYYVRLLEHKGKDELIAFYAASLSPLNAIQSYATYLSSLPIETPKENRQAALRRAAEQGLDLGDVARRTVSILLQDDFWEIANIDHNSLFNLNYILEPRHERLIYTVEWLTFDESTYKDALKQANALIRWMLTCGSTNAASETLRVLPDQLLSANIADIESTRDFDYADIRERDHFANFIKSVHLHTEWAAIFSQQPNPQSSSKAQMAEYSNKVLQMTERFYESTMKLFESDWLIPDPESLEQTTGDFADERRQTELRLIRQIYIPEMIFRIHQALYDTRHLDKENLRKSIDLVTLVADENARLWPEFVGVSNGSNRMSEFLDRIRSSSLALLEIGEDPFS